MSSTSPMHHRVVLLFGRRRLRPTTTTSQSVSFFATKRRRRGAKKMSVSSTTMRLRALVVSFFGVPLVRSLTTFESLFLWSVLSAAHSRRRRRRRRRRSEKRITTTTNNNNKKTRRVVYGMLHIVDEYNWTQKLRVIETRDVRVFTSSRKKEEMRLHNARKKRASSSYHPSRGVVSNSRLPVQKRFLRRFERFWSSTSAKSSSPSPDGTDSSNNSGLSDSASPPSSSPS